MYLARLVSTRSAPPIPSRLSQIKDSSFPRKIRIKELISTLNGRDHQFKLIPKDSIYSDKSSARYNINSGQSITVLKIPILAKLMNLDGR